MTSSIDLTQLMELARSRSTESRQALAEVMADLFSDDDKTLSDRERSLMLKILEQVIADAELAVRRSLSRKLADMSDAPRSLIQFLAGDEAKVAYPILTRSRVLFDEDLIEVIRNRTLEHQLAVAMRYSVSESVSDALVATGNTSVIETLLRNENARLSQQTLSCVVEQSRRFDTFQEPLLLRSELGPDLAKRLFLWVSAAIRHRIVDRFDLESEAIDLLLQQAAREGIEAVNQEPAAKSTERLADGLAGEGLLDSSLMLQAMANGEIKLFIGLFAQTAHLSSRMVERILFDPGIQAFAVACKGIGIDRATFSKLFEFSRHARPQRRTLAVKEKSDALSFFDRLTMEAARNVLHRWRLDPDFAAALRDLEIEKRVHG
ncbi:MAG: DUF2336 domain-containing protein [Rhodospirillales bacterium]|nr:DUF2336 domain-containing protein [Rhodospirillales bacterium]